MFTENFEAGENSDESSEQAATSGELKRLAKEAEESSADQTEEGAKGAPTGSGAKESPVDLIRMARAEIKTAEDRWENFLAEKKERFGRKRIQHFSERDPLEKEFLARWDAEERLYRETLEKFGQKPESLLSRWNPFSRKG